MPHAEGLQINKQLNATLRDAEMPSQSTDIIKDHGVSRGLLDSPPSLQRTKSILRGNKSDYDSDELFGMTSDESEGYVPETDSSEDSGDSTESNVLHIEKQSIERGRSPKRKFIRPNQHRKNRNCDSLKHSSTLVAKSRRYDNELHQHSSELMESSILQTDEGNTSMLQTLHSPAMNSGSREHEGNQSSKRAGSSTRNAVKPNKQLREGDSDKPKPQVKNRNSCPPQHSSLLLAGQGQDQVPDSSSFVGSQDLLSVRAVTKKEDGSRMYNKKQYCLFCKVGVIKISRHLERAHHNEK